jgi:O-antigen ligase
MALMLAINLFSALFVARESFFSFSMIYGQLKCYLIAFFIANYIRDSHSLRLVGYAFAAILLTQGLIVMEQLFIGVIFTDQNLGRATSLKSVADLGTIYRVSGTLGHPNAMAMYLDLIIPWVGFQLASEKYLGRKIYLGVALFLAVFAVISSGSRGGWLGLAVGAGIATLMWYRKQGRSPVVAVFVLSIVVSLVFALLFASSSTFRTRLTAGDAGAAEVRLPLMQVAEEMIRSHPITGVGLANYTREMQSYDRTNLFIASFYDQPVHNTYLLMAAETGVIGMAIFVLFMLGALLMAHRMAKNGSNEISTLGFGLLAGLISWMLHNFVNQTAPFTDSTLWFLFGLLVAANNQLGREQNVVTEKNVSIKRGHVLSTIRQRVKFRRA